MKLSMKVTERDQKLLAMLSIIVIGVLFYIFALSPIYSGMSNEKIKNRQLSEEYAELKGIEGDLDKNKTKYDQQRLDYMKISRELPTNLSEKYVISDMYKISSQISAEAGDYSFSPRAELKDVMALKGGEKSQKESSSPLKGLYAYAVTTSWNVSYGDLKKLLKLSQTYESIFALDNLSISPQEDGRLNVSFNVNFIGYDDNKAPLRVWNGLRLDKVRNGIFSIPIGGVTTSSAGIQTGTTGNNISNNTTSISTNSDIASIDKNKDFVVALSTTSSPTSNVVMEKVGEGKSIFGSNKPFENATIDVKGKSGKYQFNMSTSTEKYPGSGYGELTPRGKDIVILIYSTARKGELDKNVINIKVNNNTDKKVYVYVVGDDEKLPRCSITKGGSNVYVEKR
ncbi:hypothetical protein [Clostridium cylindrosporum]|uniref:Type IV pilus assembly protein PilO n=1 Tax=Clostridium cylindrosporum DSM 605 TaxID=1121307 RepID=A0A0J8DAE1_CLOCY|nr:hypothetical protein [Clostridium cylindrosporum]KMT21289.1 hypothetical protein CLCY_2c00490 [Clostridium cylindrosporum DSM 605]